MKRREMNALKAIGNGLCLLLLAGTTACYEGKEVVEDGVVLSDVDEEEVEVYTADAVVSDDMVVADSWDKDEYYNAFASTDHYEDWDLDDDNTLDKEEFTASFYQTFDLNKDRRISEGEWNSVLSDYAIDEADWAAWDTDGDGYMERVEFDADFAEMNWYTSWDEDGDGVIEVREYADGVFTLWDKNGDNVLDEAEYLNYNTYYGV